MSAEKLNLLDRGIKIWNKYRAENIWYVEGFETVVIPVELQGVDLSKKNLQDNDKSLESPYF